MPKHTKMKNFFIWPIIIKGALFSSRFIFTAEFTLNFLYSLDLWRYNGNGFCCIGLKKIVITNK